MKTQSIKLRNLALVFAIIAFGGASVTSCSKDKDSTELSSISGKLTISISGINLDSQFKTASTNSSSKNLNYEIKNSGDADLAIAVTNMSSSEKLSFKSSAAYEPINDDVKYVIYIYEGTNLITAKEFTAGTPGTIEGLNPTKDYKWVALSYNDTTPLNISGTNDLVLPQNTDVLYASGNINLSTNSTISVAFNHAMARIGIELNTIGVFGTISGTPEISISSGGLRTGTLNLLTGEITANAATYTPNLAFSDFEAINGSNDAMHAYFYTVPNSTTENQSLIVNIKNLTIAHYDGGSTRTYFSGANGTNFTFNIAAEKGKSKKALLNVVESAITTNQEGVTVNWARSNLYYRGALDNKSYAFYYANQQTSRADGYFSFEGTLPVRFPTPTTQGDPCALVYPQGLWAMPTQEQVSSLTTDIGILGNLLGSIGSLLGSRDEAPGSSVGDTNGAAYANYVISNAPTTSNAFGAIGSSSNELRFYYNGQISNLSVLTAIGGNGNGLLGLGLSTLSAELLGLNINTSIPVLGTSYNSQSALWTKSRYLTGPLLALLGTSVGSHGYLAYTAQQSLLGVPIGSEFIKATTSVEALSNVDLAGINLLNTSFKNVRCVRSN